MQEFLKELASYLTDVANQKSTFAVGSVFSLNHAVDQYLGMLDLSDAQFHDVVLEAKIVQPVSDDSARDLTLFWAFCSEQLENPSQAPIILQPAEFSLVCDLADASGGQTTRYYQTSILQPKGLYLYTWFDCDYLHEQLNYSNLAGAFSIGETITGSDSGATATIESDDGTSLVVDITSGQFQVGETITGGSSGATATVDAIISASLTVKLIAVT